MRYVVIFVVAFVATAALFLAWVHTLPPVKPQPAAAAKAAAEKQLEQTAKHASMDQLAEILAAALEKQCAISPERAASIARDAEGALALGASKDDVQHWIDAQCAKEHAAEPTQ